MDTKPGFKTSEIVALLAAVLSTVLPVMLDKVPPDSVWAVLLGAVIAAVTYIAGRSHVKASASKAAAVLEAAKNP